MCDAMEEVEEHSIFSSHYDMEEETNVTGNVGTTYKKLSRTNGPDRA